MNIIFILKVRLDINTKRMTHIYYQKKNLELKLKA